MSTETDREKDKEDEANSGPFARYDLRTW